MYTVYLMSETYTNGFTYEFLDILSLISIVFGIFIIISKNPIVSVLCLIFLFSSVSIYLILLGVNFIGISYLLVYVGAVSILFLFILMLINIRISEIQTETSNSLPLAIVISISFYIALYEIIPFSSMEKNLLLNSNSESSSLDFSKYFEFLYNNINYVVSNQ